MAEQTKGKPVWLCREKGVGADNGYLIFPQKTRPSKSGPFGAVSWTGNSESRFVCARKFREVFGHHPLSPGECKRVVMSVEVVEE